MHARTCVILAVALLACQGGEGSDAPQSDETSAKLLGHVGAAAAPPEPASDAIAPMARAEAEAGGFAAMSRHSAGEAAPAAPPSSRAQGPNWSSAAASAVSMIIRTGTAAVEVDSLEPAIARVQALARQVGGHVANASVQTGREQLRSATIEIKVPSARFDDIVSGLRPIGRVQRVDVQAQDVGEEFVDVSARVANARRLEQRLLDLLANRTGKLQEVLTVERELARVREEIERLEGRLRYLESRSSMSTLAVTLHEPMPIVGAYRGSSVIGEAFERAWRNFVGLTAAVIASLGILVPVAATAAGVWLLVRRHALRPRRAAADASGD